MSNLKQIQFLSTTPEDLANLISEKVKAEIESQLKRIDTTPEKKGFITREATAKLLNVTYATLWRYAKRGTLKPWKFSNKVYYKLSEIEQGFIQSM